jgi:SAM-dependent methyltransferase
VGGLAALSGLLKLPGVQRAVRKSADWVDLQYSFILEQIDKAAPRAHGRLLDVGCGDKPYEAAFRPYVTEYIGIEHEAVFHKTSAAGAERKPDLYYDGSTLPFANESFDTVMSIQVLEHTPRPQHLLNEMARVLKKDGTLILCAPFSARLHEEPHDYYRYTPHGLRVMCDVAGLEVTEVWQQGTIWSVMGHKVNTFLAFRVASAQNAAFTLGKAKHEGEVFASTASNRAWLLPVVAPAMIGVAAAARVLDRLAPDETETLSYMIFARPRPGGASGVQRDTLAG